MALMFYDDLLRLRLPAAPTGAEESMAMRPLAESDGFLGDVKTHETWKFGEREAPAYPAAWLPSARLARAWRAMATDEPFDP